MSFTHFLKIVYNHDILSPILCLYEKEIMIFKYVFLIYMSHFVIESTRTKAFKSKYFSYQKTRLHSCW